MSNPHFFIAISIPEPLQTLFAAWQTQLKNKLPYKQWYHKEDLHITLKFLGAVGTEKVPELVNHLQTLEKYKTFDLTVGKLGTFGNRTNPRVLWAGVEKTAALVDVQQEVETRMMELGFPRENREYRPHITLAKKWAGNRSMIPTDIEELKQEFTETSTLHVKAVTLFQIHPNRQQKYESIQQFPLR